MGEIEAMELLKVASLQKDINNGIKGEFQVFQCRKGFKSLCVALINQVLYSELPVVIMSTYQEAGNYLIH